MKCLPEGPQTGPVLFAQQKGVSGLTPFFQRGLKRAYLHNMKQNDGRRGAIRQNALKAVDLANMEAHGKREDESGKRRQVREAEPLVVGGLDLREQRADWMTDVKQQGNTAALHALVQYPTGLIDGTTKDQQERMLRHAVRFMNDFHGGDAVFAARLDRDEKGRHSVDVFMMPRHDFVYKDGRRQKRAAVSKQTKAEAQRRYSKQDRRAQGSALQDAWFEYMRDQMGLDVLPPQRKKATAKDRLEPEELGVKRDRQKLQEGAAVVEQGFEALEAGEDALGVRVASQDKREAAANAKISETEEQLAKVSKDLDHAATIAKMVGLDAQAKTAMKSKAKIAAHRPAVRAMQKRQGPGER